MSIDIKITNCAESPFMNKYGVYQDGTVPMCRDAEGKLWAVSGHSHMGHIGMFCGNTLENMKGMYPIELNFTVGHADYAFDKVKYPEGVNPRGSIWPFGLYICPVTNRFFIYFHNETGWNGRGTAYDSFGLCTTPAFDSDFRHVGMMHSDDQGRTWTFDRWVLTSENVCFTDKFNPGAGNVNGQKSGVISLGSGDFSMFPDIDNEYIYLFYNIVRVDMDKRCWVGCDTYVARTRKRTDGVMGDFVKYYNGSFCEPGNLGKESIIAENTWHSRVAYSEKYKKYLMTSTLIGAPDHNDTYSVTVLDVMNLRTSDNLISWSEPVSTIHEGKPFGNHYMAMISPEASGNPYVIPGDQFSLMSCHNGTDVMKYSGTIIIK